MERLSSSSRSSVLSKVAKLKSGDQIDWKHWKEGFKAPPIVDISVDLNLMYDRAIDHESRHGRNCSGDILRKHIKYLHKYQAYLYCKDISSLPIKYWKAGMLSNDEQRLRLRGHGIVLAGFNRYLMRQQGLSNERAADMCRQVDRLKEGHGITCLDWPYGVVFHPYPVEDLGADFCQLLHEAETHESVYGIRETQEGSLSNLLTNLMSYQLHCYEKNVSSSAGMKVKPSLRIKMETNLEEKESTGKSSLQTNVARKSYLRLAEDIEL